MGVLDGETLSVSGAADGTKCGLLTRLRIVAVMARRASSKSFALRAGLLTGGAMDAVISKNQREDTTGFDNGSVHDDGGEGGDRSGVKGARADVMCLTIREFLALSF
jgi:hypothetical protein